MGNMSLFASCKRFFLLVGFLSNCLLNVAAHSATPAELLVNALCHKYSGTFYWTGSNSPQFVHYQLKQKQIAENSVIATGDGAYMSGVGLTLIKVKIEIAPDSYTLVIQESEPSSSAFITDGIYVGTISQDLSLIDADWETISTGQTGKLNLKADESCLPKTIS